MNTYLHISYDTSRPFRARSAYRVTYEPTEGTPRALHQTGPVWNGIITYTGIFPTRREATAAARDYCRPQKGEAG